MKKSLSLLTALLLLGGCAGSPSNYLVLSPDVPAVESSAHGRIALTTEDARTNMNAVRITKGDEPPTLMGTGEPPARQLGELFRSAYRQIGFDLDPAASNLLELKLERIQSDISESMIGYEAENEIVISAYARNSQQIFTKRYSAKGSMKGPFSLDLATLELEMNKLITQLAGDIVNDPELNRFLMQ
ncbi:YajG family lipoprotein [Shewanella sp.]|uniref:YajG family lipoprotein n=1 Tax=Shewanella sp. TaxID=50422 RepID=UPI0035672CC6